MIENRDERSLGELFADLSRETSNLVRQEVTLAKVELSTKASKVGKDVAFIGLGAAIAYAGLLAILAAVIILLAYFLPNWLAALIVGVVVAAIGGVLVQKGLDALKQESLAPQETIQTMKENAQWAKEQTR
jgi:uncharacterized membrane protein YqjE